MPFHVVHGQWWNNRGLLPFSTLIIDKCMWPPVSVDHRNIETFSQVRFVQVTVKRDLARLTTIWRHWRMSNVWFFFQIVSKPSPSSLKCSPLSLFHRFRPTFSRSFGNVQNPSEYSATLTLIDPKYQNSCCFPQIFNKVLQTIRWVRQIYVNCLPHLPFVHQTGPKQTVLRLIATFAN